MDEASAGLACETIGEAMSGFAQGTLEMAGAMFEDG
jgi:hypothetical protein